VIEAATESMELKKKIFADLAARVSADTILATNTSALSVSDLAKTVPNPERVVGLHFFNPVHRMPLVEIITLPETSPDVLATVVSFVQKLGKTPVVVKDSPGFLVNRILVPYLMEAVRLHESGIPVKDIDEAMLEFGMPMGPMRLLDEIGLDVAAHVAKTLASAFPDRFPHADALDTMVAAGQLGKKTGQGFYRYENGKEILPTTHSDLPRHESIQTNLALLISQEAMRCLKEGIARNADDIDLAMVLGTGYPPFRGGPITFARDTGIIDY
jgi:3-hydroxyacyl-CoA dehydrogenase/enoyl-CoA hydratase/3-hydroxybutyryl-CoA epimerase